MPKTKKETAPKRSKKPVEVEADTIPPEPIETPQEIEASPLPDPEPEAPAPGGIMDLIGLIAGGMETAPQGAQEADTLTESDTPVIKDTDGTVFDPSYHAVDASGSPKLTKNGKFRKQTGAIPGNKAPIATEQPKDPEVKRVDPAKCAKNAKLAVFALEFASVQTAHNLLSPAAGAEFKMDSHEKEAIQDAFKEYFIQNGIDDLPPGWALVLTIGMYAGFRFLPGSKTNEAVNMRLDALKAKRATKSKAKPVPTREEVENGPNAA